MRSAVLTLAMPLVVLFMACNGADSVGPQQALAEQASSVIGPNGGIVMLPDGSSVSVPPGALDEEVTISIQSDPGAPVPGEGTPAGLFYLLGPEGLKFALPVTITLAFDPAEVPSGQSATSLVIDTAPRDSSSYAPLTTAVVDSLHVSATTSHFSHFVATAPPPKLVLHPGAPDSINIGFNGDLAQFNYYPTFFQAESGYGKSNPGPRLCHWYVPWNIACAEPSCTDSSHASLAEASPTTCAPFESASSETKKTLPYLACWLYDAQAQAECDEALISFQGTGSGPSPSQRQFKNAFEAFLDVPWANDTGFKGAFSFTAWNEPNNPGISGNALGHIIDPEDAATYYLTAEKACKGRGCKVAAGDFASNGNFWNDFELNCANDEAEKLCSTSSAFNAGKKRKPASYLDRYKNYIYRHRSDYKLSDEYPKYFAFHGWHDINEFLDKGSLCKGYDDCATRRLLESLSGGGWQHASIWDTEAGVGQGGKSQTKPFGSPKQACGAAFLLDLTAIDTRITRLYFTRLSSQDSGPFPQELVVAHTLSKAGDVLASRDLSIAGHCWSGERVTSAPPPPSKPPPSVSDDVCCALCAGATESYYAAELPLLDGGLQPCAEAAASFCQFNFDGGAVLSAEVGSCSVYP